MKKIITILLAASLLFALSACSSDTSTETVTEQGNNPDVETEQKNPSGVDVTSQQTETVEQQEPTSESVTEPSMLSKEEETMKQAQFYITAGGTTFTVDFAENSSTDALRELLKDGDLTIDMSDYGSFEKVGSIGQNLPREDTQISTTTGDVMLYQGNQIVIFYNSLYKKHSFAIT